MGANLNQGSNPQTNYGYGMNPTNQQTNTFDFNMGQGKKKDDFDLLWNGKALRNFIICILVLSLFFIWFNWFADGWFLKDRSEYLFMFKGIFQASLEFGIYLLLISTRGPAYPTGTMYDEFLVEYFSLGDIHCYLIFN